MASLLDPKGKHAELLSIHCQSQLYKHTINQYNIYTETSKCAQYLLRCALCSASWRKQKQQTRTTLRKLSPMKTHPQTTSHLFKGYFSCNPTFLEQGSGNFFCKGTNGKYFRIYGPHNLCWKFSTLLYSTEAAIENM